MNNILLRKQAIVVFALMLAFALFLAACGSDEPPAPGPQPAAETPEAAPALDEELAPRFVSQPLDLPPVVVATSPERGQTQPLDAPILIRFDQAMDAASTAAAFAIEPAVEGQVIVEGDRLIFTPAQPLARGERYQVAVSEEATGANGKQLAAPLELRFSAVGFLEVTSTQPAGGNQEVSVDSPVTVIFNRPVVPLTGVEQMQDLPQPLRFEPAIAGQGRWLNTSIYQFLPDEPLPGFTEIAVTVAAGLQDTTGGLLVEDYRFSFRTASPIVLGVEPSGRRVSPMTAITVTFSQPMDAAATEAAFSLEESEINAAVAGRFAWSAANRQLVFRPDNPLTYGVPYRLEIDATAKSLNGEGFLREAFVQVFETAPRIGIVRTQPASGDQEVSPETNLRVTFQGIVDEKTLGRDAFTIIPKPTGVFSYYSPWDNTWTINWPLLPQTDYQVTLSGDIGDIFGNRLGEDQVISFRTGDRRPFAHLNVPQEVGSYNAYTNTLIAASYRNVSQLDFKLYNLSMSEAVRLLGPNQWEARRNFRPEAGSLARAWTLPVSPERNANVLEKVALAEDGGPLAPGIYWVEMTAPEVSYGQNGRGDSYQEVARHLLVVSPYNLIAKRSVDEVLVWATDLQSGQPVAGLPIQVEGAGRASGVTDADGLLRASVVARESWQPLVIFAGDPVAGAVSSDWQQGIAPWEFGLPSEFAPALWQGYFYTDRPIYRPGQMVYWRGIVRQDEDAIYRVPAPGTRLQVTVRDGQGNEIYKQAHELNSFGTIHGQLALDEEAGLGWYYLDAQPMNQPKDASYIPSFGLGFQVAEYRKPEFEVKLRSDKAEYLTGETIDVSVEATYFFGGPVSDAQVEWTVYSNNAYFSYRLDSGGPWYSFDDFSGWDSRSQDYGGLLTSGSGKTDAQGRFSFQVPADISDKLQSQNFSIDVRIVDLSNQEVSGSTGVMVHKGLVYPGVAPRSYVNQVGQLSQVDLIAVDWASQPVAGQELAVVVSKAEWKSVQEKGEDGRFYWATQVDETPVLTETLTTGGDGKALLTWTPSEGGQYKINATAIDNQSNAVRSSAFVWVSGQPDTYVAWRVENNDRIELVADKSIYQIGDRANVLVPHPFQGAVEALVTVERGVIRDVRRVTLNGNSEMLEVPIEESYVPNVFVSVVIVAGANGGDLGTFKIGNVELPVDTGSKELLVTLTPNKSELKPGEVVTFTVQVNDAFGDPVQGEFSLALVDKALLALSGGNSQSGRLLDTFYRERGLGIQTAATMVVNLDRLNAQLQEGAKGGGGGDGMAGMFVDVRSEFEDLALWEPTLVTDANGQAVVSVRLPDNLTTWQLDGRGVTVDTKVGQATVEIVTTLPLLVRPVLPRFFVSGDQAVIGAIVNNNTGVERTVAVEMTASGLTSDADATQQVSVPAGGQIKLNWPVSIASPPPAEAVGQVVVRFTAVEIGVAGGLSDGVEMTLPVYRYSSPETVATAGTVDLGEERTEVIVLPEAVDPTQGDLRVRLEPSLAAGMLEGLAWLEHFPYECNEQIVSKFLPNVVTYRALQKLGVERPDLESELREQIATAMQKLIRRQNPDGGWGWWGGEESRAFVSSYVLFGLTEARKAGFVANDDVIARAAAYLSRQLRAVDGLKDWELNQQAFLLYVLAEAGRGDVGRTVSLYDVRERLGHYGRAYLALAFGVLGEQGEATAQERIDVLLDDLSGAAILSATGVHWEEAGRDWWTMNTDTRSTSLALAALARLSPSLSPGEGRGGDGGALAPNGSAALTTGAVRWLMTIRENGRWQTTQENAWAIIALTDWMVATGELDADYSYSVSLNGQGLAEGSANRQNVDEPVELRVEVRDLLLDAANGLTISRFAEGSQSGDGQLYYTAHLNYFQPAADLQALDRGVALARQYRIVDPLTGMPKEDVPVTEAQVGDTIQVKLTIVAPHNLHYLVVESPLPAGAEAIDPGLATTSQVYEGPGLEPAEQPENGWPWWWWTPSYSELRDEKVVLFATELPAGAYEYTYQMRASLPGQFQTLPATAYEMYFPEVWGRSAGEMFRIVGE